MPDSSIVLSTPSTLHDAFRAEMGNLSRQSAVYFAGTVFTLVAGLFFKIYIARTLGAEGLGQYALGASVVAFFTLFANWGIPRAMVRFIPAYRAQDDVARIGGLIWRGGVIVALASSALAIVLFLAREEIATRLFGELALAPILGLFAGLLPLGTLGHLLDQIVVGFQQTARSKSINSFFTYPLFIALTILFLHLGWGVPGYILATLASSAAGIIALGRVVRQLIPAASQGPAAPRSLEPAVWRYALSMAFLGMWGFLSSEADKLILGAYLPSASVGVYSVALTIAALIPMLLTSVNSIFAPTISHLQAQGQRRLLEQIFQTLNKWTLGLTWPLIGVVLCFPSELMGVFGSEFRGGWIVLVVIALGQLVNVGAGSVGIMLLMTGHQRQLIRTQITSAVAMLAFYLVLIPGWGILGAALAQAIGSAIANGLNLWHVRRRLGMLPYSRSLLRLLGPIAGSGACLIGFKLWAFFGLTDLVRLGTSLVLAYITFGVLALCTGLDENDRVVLKAIWGQVTGRVR